MERAKAFFIGYFTTVLSVLVVLNVVALLFILMGVGWDQVVAASTHLVDRVKDKDRLLSGSTTNSSTANSSLSSSATSSAQLTAGAAPSLTAFSDPNLSLVCSDETFSTAVAKVRPAVVNISCDSIQPATQIPGFLRFEDPAQDLPAVGGIGSGIIVHSSGYVLTCLHVVKNANSITVTPFGSDAKRLSAQLVAQDDGLNLALLKINAGYELPAATTGDSALMEVADMVLAIGNPFGLEQTVTHGIISDNERDLVIDGKVYRQMMQTDAAINRGSSGGPLINLSGEVIGINMAIYSTTGVYHGISFALPVNQAKRFLAKVLPQGDER